MTLRGHLIRALLRGQALLPLPWAQALGAALGRGMYRVPNRSRAVSAINLERCLPELDEAARDRLLRASLIEMGRTAFEVGAMWAWSEERLFGRLEVLGTDPLDAAQAAGRGLILATPHLGNWELAGHYVARRWGAAILYRPPRHAELEDLVRAGRMHLGAELVTTDASGVRTLYRRLRQGGAVGILPDQEPGAGGGEFAPFFGMPAYTVSLVHRLLQKTDAAFFFGYCQRLPGGRYRLEFFPPPAEIYAADAQSSLAALNAGVEALVRRCPEQYQWSYRRFRTRPPGEPPIY